MGRIPACSFTHHRNKISCMKWRRLNTGNYMGHSGEYYVFARRIKIYTYQGHEAFRSWWRVFIGSKGEWITGEGLFGTSLNTLVKAKAWAKNKIKMLNSGHQA